MKKLFFAVSLLLPFSGAFLAVWAYTEFSSYFRPTASGSTYSNLGSPSNAYDDPDSTYALFDFTSGGQSLNHTFTDFDGLPTGVIPKTVTVKLVVQRVSSTGVVNVGVFGSHQDSTYTNQTLCQSATAYACSGGAQIFSNTNLANNTSIQTIEFYFSDEDGVASDVSNYFTNYGWDPSTFVVIVQSAIGSTVQDLRIHDIQVKVAYEPVTSIVNFTGEASASAQLVKLSMDGYTAYAGENVTCDLAVFQECTREGFAGISSDTPVAHIKLDPNNDLDFTNSLGGGYYDGYGYSETSSHWFADNVEVPYNPGFTCHYPIQTTCVHQELTCNEEDPPICTWGASTVVVSSYDEGLTREVVHSSLFDEPEPSDPLSWIVWKAKQILYDFFTFNGADTLDVVQDFRQQLDARAPFGYMSPLFDLDLSDPATGSAVPDITFTIPGVDTPYTFVPGSDLLSWFSLIKNACRIVIWLIFVGYLFMLPRRLI